ncbi:hypothetical protein X564_04365 [Pseudoalteromonas agarivorans]|nr:hypothetical protein X564_04365 [Pseudoalteromonas agarivorans]
MHVFNTGSDTFSPAEWLSIIAGWYYCALEFYIYK